MSSPSWKSVHRKIKRWHIFIYALIFSLTVFSLLYVARTAVSIIPTTLSKFSLNYHPSSSQFEPSAPVTLVLILCNDGQHGVSSSNSTGSKEKIARNFQRQINQTVVLLKSIVVQEAFLQDSSSVPVEVLVLSDRFENFHRLETAIREEKWPVEFLEKIRLTFVPAAYPPGAEWMRKLFRPCATLRLFLDQLLPTYDSVIYIDTDLIFLRPISELWSEFGHFDPENLAALAPCLNHYGTLANSIPFYGKTGLNAGVMLMNLTRIRGSPWIANIRHITKDFLKQIKLADQDILNIYFNANPSELHQLSCDWNFRPFQCRRGSFCLDWQLGNGISALHGNALSFTKFGPEPIFHAVFSTFQSYNLTSGANLKNLVTSLRREVMRVQRNKKAKSHCALYGAFPVLLLNRMNLRARELKIK